MNSNNNETGHTLRRMTQVLGLGLVVIGALAILVQGMVSSNFSERFILFSVILLGVVFGAKFFSKQEQHNTTSDLFRGIFLTLVPVYISQVGAIVYATYPQQGVFSSSLLNVTEGAFGLMLFAIVFLFALVLPLHQQVFSTFVDGKERLHIMMFSVLTILLILPYRVGAEAQWIACIVGSLAYIYDRQVLSPYTLQIKTFIARLSLVLFPLIYLIRNSSYSVSYSLLALFFVILGTTFYWFSDRINKENLSISISAELCITLAIACISQYARDCLTIGCAHFIYYFAPAIYLLLRSHWSGEGKKTLRSIACGILAVGSVMFSDDQTTIGEIAGIIFPLITIAYGFATGSIVLLIFGSCGEFIALLQYLAHLWVYMSEYKWISLMISGLAILGLSPYIEKGIHHFQEARSKKGN